LNAKVIELANSMYVSEEGEIEIKDGLVVRSNQIKAANQIFEHLRKGAVDVIKLTAEMQSGKTGAVFFAIHMYMEWRRQEKEKGNFIPDLKILVLGPSDRELKDQTYDRIQEWELINPYLLGSRILHMPDLLKSSRNERALKLEIEQFLNIGGNLIVLWDESHIGIQKKRGGEEQVLPSFLREFASLPGMTTNSKVKHIMVTATPFTLDYFQHVCRENKINLNIESVFLEPGKGYVGFLQLLRQGRIKQALGPFTNKQKQDFLNEVIPFLKKQKIERGNKYAIIRCTVNGQVSWWQEACALAGISYTFYNSNMKNIPEFKKKLSQSPQTFEVLVIQRSYKQGKTLPKKHIGFWYENLTKSGRNDADVWQSAGRCCGYHESQYDFDIFMNVEQAKEARAYYSQCALNDIDGAISRPTSDAATKRISKIHVERHTFIGDTFEEVVEWLEKRYGSDVLRSQTPSLCSANNEADVAHEVRYQKPRQSSENGERRYNIRHLDKANPKYKNSWNRLDQSWRGKFAVVWDERNTVQVKVKKANGVFDPDVKIAEQQGSLF